MATFCNPVSFYPYGAMQTEGGTPPIRKANPAPILMASVETVQPLGQADIMIFVPDGIMALDGETHTATFAPPIVNGNPPPIFATSVEIPQPSGHELMMKSCPAGMVMFEGSEQTTAGVVEVEPLKLKEIPAPILMGLDDSMELFGHPFVIVSITHR